ncbi:MAG: uncharacterized protein A8A55_2768 [Amphiamblys sp. WSBS2006]|nr:MAG: uncharacterized protein A8A55_2768 [Amphiamblys sp. WSBS2006]
MKLNDYAVNVLPKLMVKELKIFELAAFKESHVSNILNAGNRRIDIGGVKKLELYGYAVNVLQKLKIGEDNKVEMFMLRKKEEDSMTNILSMGDGSIEVRRIQRNGFVVPEEIKPKLKYILVYSAVVVPRKSS